MNLNEASQGALILKTPEYQQMMNNYVSILEKTNQQLGVWSNPYGIAIGILSIFIAIIAICVGFALWRHSKEQKERFDKFLLEQEKVIQTKNKRFEQVELKFDALIKGYEEQLKSATKNNKIEIEKAIADLKKEKASLGAYIGPSAAFGTASLQSIASPFVGSSPLAVNTGSMICAKCGRTFSYYNDNDLLSSAVMGSLTVGGKNVYCTHCGHLNIQ